MSSRFPPFPCDTRLSGSLRSLPTGPTSSVARNTCTRLRYLSLPQAVPGFILIHRSFNIRRVLYVRVLLITRMYITDTDSATMNLNTYAVVRLFLRKAQDPLETYQAVKPVLFDTTTKRQILVAPRDPSHPIFAKRFPPAGRFDPNVTPKRVINVIPYPQLHSTHTTST